MGQAIGLDWVDAFRFNAILERRHGHYRPGANDVVFGVARKIEIWGDPTVIESLRLALSDWASPSPRSTPSISVPPARPAGGRG